MPTTFLSCAATMRAPGPYAASVCVRSAIDARYDRIVVCRCAGLLGRANTSCCDKQRW
jgi:hypothetical protein